MKKIYLLVMILLLNNALSGQKQAILPALTHKGCSHQHALEARAKLPEDIRYKVPLPLQQNYIPKAITKSKPANGIERSVLLDITEVVEGIHAAFVRIDNSPTNIDYFVYGIGSDPGNSNQIADIRWWQILNANSTKTTAHSMFELGLDMGDVFYISVYYVDTNGNQSATVHSDKMSFQWEELGHPTYDISVDFHPVGFDANGNTISGWTTTDINTFNDFLSKMLPIIKSVYGPPARDMTVTLVRDLYYSSSNIYFSGNNQIHQDDGLNPQLLTHELLHAWRDNVIIAADENWKYSPVLSGFEESFAQGASYACMQKFYDLYPNDPLVADEPNWGSTKAWDYDFHNRSILTTQDFWSSNGGTSITWERYEMGAAAMLKAYQEDENFFKNYNAEYYNRLNVDHSITPTRTLCRDIFQTVLQMVEFTPTATWIDNQRIFDCEIIEGFKIYDRTQHYPYWQNYYIFNRVAYYETFSTGSEWTWYNTTTSSWEYYNQNGAMGTATLRDYNGTIAWQNNNFQITPTDNVPVVYDMGSAVVNMTTSSTQDPWPGGEASEFAFDMDNFGLYTFEIDFPNASIQVPRVLGDDLIWTKGVFGGILNDNAGMIYIDHEDMPAEPALNIVNGAFFGDRTWTGISNAITGYSDSQPGKVGMLYIDADCNKYYDFRNIGWGSFAGNQLFLLDKNKMTPIEEKADFTFNIISPNTVEFTNTSTTHSHEVFDFQEAPPTYHWDFGDGQTTTVENPTHSYLFFGSSFEVCLTITHGCWSETKCKTLNPSSLPIELLSFEATPHTNHVDLSWKTSTERHNKGFQIQKSGDKNTWETIGFIKGQGTSATAHNYTYQDKQPYIDWNYYRLKQLNQDGTFTYSEVVAAQFIDKHQAIHIFPNPVQHQLNVEFLEELFREVVHIEIFNSVGQLVLAQAIRPSSFYQVDISTLPKGTYYLRVEDGFSKSFVKQ